MRLQSKLAIRCAKATCTLIKRLNRGSGAAFPGYIARLIDPAILSILSGMVREKIIVTVGTNGKTTSNSILYHTLEAEGKRVIANRTGANMLNGIISAFVLSADKKGNLDADYACLEVDELASVYVLGQLKPDCILITNISRDQLDRFGEVDITLHKLKEAFAMVPEAKLVVNCDDALTYALAEESNNSFITYGINQQIFDEVSRPKVRDSTICRFCGKKLEYTFFHYGHLGHYYCPNCGLERPEPDYTATSVDCKEEKYSFDIDGVPMYTKARTPYNVYNTLAAYAVLRALEAPTGQFQAIIENFDYGNNREDFFTIHGARVQLHLAKNPIGFQQKLSLILKDARPKDVIININDTYQDGEDVSWLWDVDLQYLVDANSATITTSGTRRYDMGLRLKYEDIPCDTTTDLQAAIEKLTQEGTGNLYVIVNYSGLYSTNHLLDELQDTTRGENKA